MKKGIFFIAVLIIGLLANAGIYAQTSGTKPYKQMWAKPYLDQKAPELVVEKWLNGEPDLKGKFLLIDFWATWCGPCKRAIPELNRWYEKYKDKLVVVGLSDETETKVSAMKQPVIGYYSAIDTQKRLKSTYQVTGIPHVVLIDPQGIVRWEGFPFLQGNELTDAVLDDIFLKYSK